MGTTRTKVTEYEFDENGRIVKEIETITENEIPPFKFDSLWKDHGKQSYRPFGDGLYTPYLINRPGVGSILSGGYL